MTAEIHTFPDGKGPHGEITVARLTPGGWAVDLWSLSGDGVTLLSRGHHTEAEAVAAAVRWSRRLGIRLDLSPAQRRIAAGLADDEPGGAA